MAEHLTPAAAAAKVKILTYHGRQFVTGLNWHPLGSLTAYMREARAHGKEHRMDIVAIRHTDSVIQAGFVSRSAGAVKGMYSLAAALAGQLGNSWLAAWRVSPDEDLYAIVAVVEGAVIPGYDLVGPVDLIQRKVAQLLSRSDKINQIYLPPEFNRGVKPFDIEELLKPEHLKREHRLRPLAFGLSTGELTKLGVIALFVVGSLVGWKVWHDHKLAAERAAAALAEQQRLAELEEMNRKSREAQTLQALEHPWAKRPGVADFLEGCNGAINRLPLAIAGWVFSSAQCDGVMVSTNYKRAGNSTSNDFIAATTGHFVDSPAFFDAGNGAALKVALELPLAGDDTLQPPELALANVGSWLQQQLVELAVKEVPVVVPHPQPLPGQPAPPEPPPPDFKHYELSYTSPLPPEVTLRGVPATGLRLREIKSVLQSDRLVWSVIGDLYVK